MPRSWGHRVPGEGGEWDGSSAAEGRTAGSGGGGLPVVADRARLYPADGAEHAEGPGPGGFVAVSPRAGGQRSQRVPDGGVPRWPTGGWQAQGTGSACDGAVAGVLAGDGRGPAGGASADA